MDSTGVVVRSRLHGFRPESRRRLNFWRINTGKSNLFSSSATTCIAVVAGGDRNGCKSSNEHQ